MEPDYGSLADDKIIHERARLRIVTYLASSAVKAVAFNALRDALDLTGGNLSVQLRTLQEAGYIAVTKEFRDKKPLTRASITSKGTAALKRYVEQMDTLIKRLRK